MPVLPRLTDRSAAPPELDEEARETVAVDERTPVLDLDVLALDETAGAEDVLAMETEEVTTAETEDVTTMEVEEMADTPEFEPVPETTSEVETIEDETVTDALEVLDKTELADETGMAVELEITDRAELVAITELADETEIDDDDRLTATDEVIPAAVEVVVEVIPIKDVVPIDVEAVAEANTETEADTDKLTLALTEALTDTLTLALTEGIAVTLTVLSTGTAPLMASEEAVGEVELVDDDVTVEPREEVDPADVVERAELKDADDTVEKVEEEMELVVGFDEVPALITVEDVEEIPEDGGAALRLETEVGAFDDAIGELLDPDTIDDSPEAGMVVDTPDDTVVAVFEDEGVVDEPEDGPVEETKEAPEDELESELTEELEDTPLFEVEPGVDWLAEVLVGNTEGKPADEVIKELVGVTIGEPKDEEPVVEAEEGFADETEVEPMDELVEKAVVEGDAKVVMPVVLKPVEDEVVIGPEETLGDKIADGAVDEPIADVCEDSIDELLNGFGEMPVEEVMPDSVIESESVLLGEIVEEPKELEEATLDRLVSDKEVEEELVQETVVELGRVTEGVFVAEPEKEPVGEIEAEEPVVEIDETAAVDIPEVDGAVNEPAEAELVADSEAEAVEDEPGGELVPVNELKEADPKPVDGPDVAVLGALLEVLEKPVLVESPEDVSAEDPAEELADSKPDGALERVEATELLATLEGLLLVSPERDEPAVEKLVMVAKVLGIMLLGRELVDPMLLEVIETWMAVETLDVGNEVALENELVVPELASPLLDSELVDPEPLEVAARVVVGPFSVLAGKVLLPAKVVDPELGELVIEDPVALADALGTLLDDELVDSEPGKLLDPRIEELRMTRLLNTPEALLIGNEVTDLGLDKLVDVDPAKLVIEDSVALADTLEIVLARGLVDSGPDEVNIDELVAMLDVMELLLGGVVVSPGLEPLETEVAAELTLALDAERAVFEAVLPVPEIDGLAIGVVVVSFNALEEVETGGEVEADASTVEDVEYPDSLEGILLDEVIDSGSDELNELPKEPLLATDVADKGSDMVEEVELVDSPEALRVLLGADVTETDSTEVKAAESVAFTALEVLLCKEVEDSVSGELGTEVAVDSADTLAGALKLGLLLGEELVSKLDEVSAGEAVKLSDTLSIPLLEAKIVLGDSELDAEDSAALLEALGIGVLSPEGVGSDIPDEVDMTVPMELSDTLELAGGTELGSDINVVESSGALDTGGAVALADGLRLLLGEELVDSEPCVVAFEEASGISDTLERLLLVVEVTNPLVEGPDGLVELSDALGVLLAEEDVGPEPAEIADGLGIPLLMVEVMNPELD
ncbi:hypothetical protein MMC30_004265 [Trapelia coarctata]|nr:hypothetical protein [Trapelia coarctata]